MNNDELIEYAIRTSKVIKEEIKPKLIDYFYQKQERIEYLERSNNRREDTIFEQSQKINDLEDNWNKLKIWLEEYNISNERWYSNELSNHDREYYKKDYLDCKFFINKFIDKMQELENETANNCNDCKQCKGSDSNE